MLQNLLLATLLSTTSVGGGGGSVCMEKNLVPAADSLKAVYEGGVSFPDFLADAKARKELWISNSEKSASIDSALVARARAVPGSWRLLAVAIDGCSDSVNTIPYIGQLVQLVDSLDMRIVNSTIGRSIMEAHPTHDGRAATPTLVLLNSEWQEVGCFIERPTALQMWMAERKDSISSSALQNQKMSWYAEDAGRATIAQIVAMLEAAAEGKPICK